jgi:hypothetical protein
MTTERPEAGTAGRTCGLEGLRESVGRLAERFRRLPVDTRATCPTCRRVVDARFERAGRQVLLRFDCDACGPRRQVHADAIWTDAAPDLPGSAERTRTGAPVQPVHRRLPRTVETLCPECCAAVVGRYFVRDGQVLIEKTCPDHGHFLDRVSSDVLLYSKAAWWSFEEHPGQAEPDRPAASACPSDCGLCGRHQSAACLAQIDLTNRCNMRCPICFANAGVTGRVVEPDFDEVMGMLRRLRRLDPPATAVQFTGGEPTIHPDFLRIVSAATEMGFSHIQIATNGLTLARPGFAERAAEAGLHTLYLQFDGVGEAPHRQTRNHPGIWEAKLAAIDACRRAGLKICLVPTILKGVNDEQVGEIFRFAVERADVISGISYQPVSFSGRIDPDELAARRYTLGDLAGDIAAASGAEPLRDMYPLSIVTALGQFLQAVTGQPKIRPSCHPDCAFGTYFLVSPEGKAYPFPAVVDVEGLFWEMNRMAARLEGRGRAGRLNWLDKAAVLRMFKRHFRPEAAPPGLDVSKFMHSLKGLVDKNVGRGAGEKTTYKTLLCAGMHFQDRYNFDVQRVKRCVILYSTREGVFPFCTYNCGPEYRHAVEGLHARSPSAGT